MRKLLLLLFCFVGFVGSGGCTASEKDPASGESGSEVESAPLSLPMFHGETGLPPADSILVNVGDTRLFVKTMGSGPAIVFIHGGPGMSHHYLLPSLAYLSRGFRLIFYDQRLSGQSDAQCDPEFVTMDQWIQDLEAVREAVGEESFSIVSHSWGTRVGLRYAATYPDRVEKIVFLNPVGLNPIYAQEALITLQARVGAEDNHLRQELISSEAFVRGDKEAVLQAYRMSFAQNVFRRDALDSMQLFIPDRAPVRQQLLAKLYLDPALELYDDYVFLEQIKSPSLVVWGDYEANPKEAIQEMMLHLNKSRLVEIPDCGHFSFLEAPEMLAISLEPFLSS